MELAHCRPRVSDNTIGRTLKTLSSRDLQKQWVSSTGGQCGVRSQHGRCAGGLSPAARSGVSRGVLGRGFKATDYRNANADPGEARTNLRGMTMSMSATAPRTRSRCSQSLEGWRHVKVTDRQRPSGISSLQTSSGEILADDSFFAKAKKIVLMEDNLQHPRQNQRHFRRGLPRG